MQLLLDRFGGGKNTLTLMQSRRHPPAYGEQHGERVLAFYRGLSLASYRTKVTKVCAMGIRLDLRRRWPKTNSQMVK